MSDELDQVRRELARTRTLLNVLLALAVMLLLLPNLTLPILLPKFEAIFTDMLGSLAKLPSLTLGVLAYGRALHGIGLIPVLLAPSVAVCVALFVAPRSVFATLSAVLTIVALAFHFFVIVFALFMPLIQIIQGLNEKT